MNKYIFFSLISVLSGASFAGKDGFVVCNDDQEYTFQQYCGVFGCEPNRDQQLKANELCDREHGGVNRGDEGWSQHAERGKNSTPIEEALRYKGRSYFEG